MKVTIEGAYYKNRTLPSLNDYLNAIGKNPKAGGRFKVEYMKVCIWSIRKCLRGQKVTKPPVILHYKFYESKKGKKRDVSNIFSLCAKFFEDALQVCGIIENDNPEWVSGFTTEFHWIDSDPYIEIEIEERGEDGTEESGRDSHIGDESGCGGIC